MQPKSDRAVRRFYRGLKEDPSVGRLLRIGVGLKDDNSFAD